MGIGGVNIGGMSAIKKDTDIDMMLHRLAQKHPKYAILFAIGHTTGLRISDVLALRANILNKDKIQIKEQKTGKPRQIILTQDVRDLVEKHCRRYRLSSRDFLIFSHDYDRKRHLSRVQAYRVMRSVGADMGLDRIGTHCMRKTYAQSQYKATGDIVATQKELNHKYLTTTILYLADGDLTKIKFD